MTWLKKLYDTYESIAYNPEKYSPDNEFFEPYMHKLEKCHIEIKLDQNGCLIDAKNLVTVVDGSKPPKYEGKETIIPVTPKSLTARTSGPAPYGLAEKIQYLSPSYLAFGGEKKSSIKTKSGAVASYYDLFIGQLRGWCDSEFSDWKVEAVLSYLEKGLIIEDLIKQQCLFVDESEKLLSKWDGSIDQKPELFKVSGMNDQGGLMVRWVVYRAGEVNPNTWGDSKLISKWIDYQKSLTRVSGDSTCMILGISSDISNTHPKGLIQTKDAAGAKLVSSPTDPGYLTFQGRFLTENQAVQISTEVSQKAHNALRWLVRRQGQLTSGNSAVICWATSRIDVPQPFSDPDDWGDEELESIEPEISVVDHSIDIGHSFATTFKKKLAGYRSGKKLEPTDEVVVMALDSATPGRMAISYYRDFRPVEYFDNLQQWHLDFAWWQRASKDKQEHGKDKWFLSAPGLWTMLQAVYGDIVKSNDALKKNLAERMLPAIIEKRPPPKDIVQRAFQRAVARHSFKKEEQWLWEQNLGVACALYRGWHVRHPIKDQRRNYTMALDLENRSRDYLYGRLLAVAENIEQFALDKAGEGRSTTAARMMQRFADRPYSAWRTIELALQPYMQRLQNNAPQFLASRKRLLDEIQAAFHSQDFLKDKTLAGEFLLGFHCQRLAFVQKKSTEKTETTSEEGTVA